MKKILITGSTGFIGSNLLKELYSRNKIFIILRNKSQNTKKIKNYKNIKYQNSVENAIRSIDLQENDIILITGSLYLAGEVLNLN